MKRTVVIIAVLFMVLIPALTWGEVTVEIQDPVLVTSPSSPFYALITSMNDALSQTGGPLDGFADQVAGELSRFSEQDDLALGFANAGAAGSHVGTLRSFSDYRRFALVVSPGGALAVPGTDMQQLETSGDTLMEEGDTYVGAALQPIVVSFGLHLAPLIENLYLNAKFGTASIADGVVADGLTFDSYSVGVMANYQLMRSRKLPLGFIKWRGLSIGSGVLYQENHAEYTLPLSDFYGDDEAAVGTVTFADIGLDTQLALDLLGLTAVTPGDSFAELSVTPTLTAAIESKSLTIPIEVSTGFRLLWLFNVNLGAGIDISTGSSSVGVSSQTVLGFDVSNAVTDIGVTDGYVNVASTTTGDGPEFIRPRLTGGVGVNLGPIKLDVPVMYYPDGAGSEGTGDALMFAVNVGLVW